MMQDVLALSSRQFLVGPFLVATSFMGREREAWRTSEVRQTRRCGDAGTMFVLLRSRGGYGY